MSEDLLAPAAFIPTKEPLRHIARPALPWRAPTETRCGHQVVNMGEGRVITLDDAIQIVKSLGRQRAAFVLCQTCSNTYTTWPEFGADPVGLVREYAAHDRRSTQTANGESLLAIELRAIAALIAAHRQEFDKAVAALGSDDVVSLAHRRKPRR